MNNDLALEMQRLFDHYNFDHIPEDRRLDGFKQRDLPLVKHYKAAVNIFGGPKSRKRVIIAPPMETPLKRKLGMYMHVPSYPPAPVLNNPTRPQSPRPKVLSSEELHEQVGHFVGFVLEANRTIVMIFLANCRHHFKIGF
jgi:hypothetical protein